MFKVNHECRKIDCNVYLTRVSKINYRSQITLSIESVKYFNFKSDKARIWPLIKYYGLELVFISPTHITKMIKVDVKKWVKFLKQKVPRKEMSNNNRILSTSS